MPACSKSESAANHDRASATGAEARSKPFLASARREVYHLATCKWAAKINDDNLLGYDTAADAEADGFRLCKICEAYIEKVGSARAMALLHKYSVIDVGWLDKLIARTSLEHNISEPELWKAVPGFYAEIGLVPDDKKQAALEKLIGGYSAGR